MLYLRKGNNLHNITGFNFYFRFNFGKVFMEISKSYELDIRVWPESERFNFEFDLTEPEMEHLSLLVENYLESGIKVLNFVQIVSIIKSIRSEENDNLPI